MNNPFFGALGGGNGFMQMLQQFQQFKANFQGDPKAEVDKLLQSGVMSQQELNNCKRWRSSSSIYSIDLIVATI